MINAILKKAAVAVQPLTATRTLYIHTRLDISRFSAPFVHRSEEEIAEIAFVNVEIVFYDNSSYANYDYQLPQNQNGSDIPRETDIYEFQSGSIMPKIGAIHDNGEPVLDTVAVKIAIKPDRPLFKIFDVGEFALFWAESMINDFDVLQSSTHLVHLIKRRRQQEGRTKIRASQRFRDTEKMEKKMRDDLYQEMRRSIAEYTTADQALMHCHAFDQEIEVFRHMVLIPMFKSLFRQANDSNMDMVLATLMKKYSSEIEYCVRVKSGEPLIS